MENKQDMSNIPVVVVIATHGEERVDLLLNRALPSVKKQIDLIDLVVVVSDNDEEHELLTQELVRSGFNDDEHKVILLPNIRTRRMSGTGAWNTGIMKAFELYGMACWIAILDDDDEWKEDHIKLCLDSSRKNADVTCQWVASGIIRRRNGKKDYKEPIPETKPTPDLFFSTNPGIQGSNIFVHCSLMMNAGMFDEALPSTTDRDLCIRLCDQLKDAPDGTFQSTLTHTVIHYAVETHNRVSAPGSTSKIEGLKRFYFKHAPRMSESQRIEFMNRAKGRFGCDKGHFQAQGSVEKSRVSKDHLLVTWSNENLKLNRFTKMLLPSLNLDKGQPKTKQEVVVGIITADLRRLGPLLDDLGKASESLMSNFRTFVVVFANRPDDPLFAASVRDAINKHNLKGYVLDSSNAAVQQILMQCESNRGNEEAATNWPLPICQARTVLQVFIFRISKRLPRVDAVAILDDDKRLPEGWSPLPTDLDPEGADAQIGRDLRTPPNPSLLSLRTNLLDVIYAFDLADLERNAITKNINDSHEVLRFCRASDFYANKFDWYYDKSSSRSDHLELPAFSYGFNSTEGHPFTNVDMLKGLRSSLLVGTPFARDVIPPLNSEPTTHRGGCLVVFNKDESSLDVLAVEQDAPVITLANGSTVQSRRSDSFWCKKIKEINPNRKIETNPSLYVYHDNTFDTIYEPSVMRRGMVQEVLGAVLCRDKESRRHFKDKTVLDLKLWILRIQGLLKVLRGRKYFNNEMYCHLIEPLEKIFDDDQWTEEVFKVIDEQFDVLEKYEPSPTDFRAQSIELRLSEADMDKILFEFKQPSRIQAARDALRASLDANVSFIGIGHEGVVFQSGNFAYKVMDEVPTKELPKDTILNIFDASYVKAAQLSVIRSPFISGNNYRGGYGCAMLQLLVSMKKNRVGTRNISPDNIMIKEEKNGGVKLVLVDLGRDLFMVDELASFALHFRYSVQYRDMCRRAFLCNRFGADANSEHGLSRLKQWMRESSRTEGQIPELRGFDQFMARLEVEAGKPRYQSVFQRLHRHRDVSPILVSALPGSVKLDGTIDANGGNSDVMKLIETEVRAFSHSSSRKKLAICVEDPFYSQSQSRGTSLWLYRRHLRRLSDCLSLSISEEEIEGTDLDLFETNLEYCIFFLSKNNCEESYSFPRGMKNGEHFVPTIDVEDDDGSSDMSGITGCHLMIKSCPMEHETIFADVYRIVRTLENASTFKSITLLVDWSVSNEFLRQYTTCDENSLKLYRDAIEQIRCQGLVDEIIDFSAISNKNGKIVRDINQRWFGVADCLSTHSASRQQYASTLFGFDKLRQQNCYNHNDLVLQCDSDIMFHCDPRIDGVSTCLSYFREDPNLLTFSFPTLSKNPDGGTHEKIYYVKGRPCRFEIRCSFIHLARLDSMLPLKLHSSQKSDNAEYCIKPGWWRILDKNIEESKKWKSLRGGLAKHNAWFFVHPQNYVKKEQGALRMLAIGNCLSNASLTNGSTDNNGSSYDAWEKQKGQVDLVYSQEWLCERNEPHVVIVHYDSKVLYGRFVMFLESLRRQLDDLFGKNSMQTGLILLNDSTDNQDLHKKLYQVASTVFPNKVSCLDIGVSYGWKTCMEHAISSMCGNQTSIVTLAMLDHSHSQYSSEAISGVQATLFKDSKDTKTIQFLMGLSNTDILNLKENKGFLKACQRTSNSDDSIELKNSTNYVCGLICDECCAWASACGCSMDSSPANRIVRSMQLLQNNKNDATTDEKKITLPEDDFPSEVCSTQLPIRITTGKRLATTVYASAPIVDGGLKIELVALVKSDDLAATVMNNAPAHVRIHSECLTGDVFLSKKCDCGEQKTRFMDNIMNQEPHAVLLYIKGHEGRGAGLFNKIKAYASKEKDPSITHIEALTRQGCKIDARGYDVAVRFLRHRLKISSLILHTNNPEKIAAVKKHYNESEVEIRSMSTRPDEDNGRYLREKVDYLGHHQQLIEEETTQNASGD